jgi:predicted RecA/RadA family phage recombinase
MSTNYRESGDRAVVAAPEAADSGEFLIVGALAGVAEVAALNGADAVLKRTGVWELPKAVSGTAWTQGMRLYWDAAEKKFTTVAAGNRPMGVAWEAALDAATTGLVLLTPELAGLRVVGGQHTTASATDTVPTGLSRVLAAVVSYETDPADANNYVSAQIGDQAGAPAAGSIVIKSWKNTGGNDPTPAAADAFSKVVNWIAFGY